MWEKQAKNLNLFAEQRRQRKKHNTKVFLYVSTIIRGTEDCKAKARDRTKRISQRKALKILEASEMKILEYQRSRIDEKFRVKIKFTVQVNKA
jgi:hypothetical protein